MIKVGIIGGGTSVAGELLRLLFLHPDVMLKFVQSATYAGRPLQDVHSGLWLSEPWTFVAEPCLQQVDLLFLCGMEGIATRFLQQTSLPEQVKVIDFTPDHRLSEQPGSEDFVYGLPELNRRATCSARFVANPGAVATAVTLALLPLAKNLMLNGDMLAHLVVGRACPDFAGQSHAFATDHGERLLLQTGKPAEAVQEIKQNLSRLQNSFSEQIHLLPCVGGCVRGMHATVMVKAGLSAEALYDIYADYYAKDSFVHLSHTAISPHEVVHTNNCLIHLQKLADAFVITTVMDGLLKGAAAQAVHNMNLMFNLQEKVGLNLKSGSC